ncbi:PEP-CTERM sorting domain-containing protein [Acidiphilium sp.]|uniref:PEP-CTERM sorting domain-containing protein n=1 Tax=Acidiphilium sp. TaxID=527 RepID=UPI003D070EE5
MNAKKHSSRDFWTQRLAQTRRFAFQINDFNSLGGIMKRIHFFTSIRTALLGGVCVLCAAAYLTVSARAGALETGINLGDSPDSAFYNGVVDEGWLYTPTSSYNLSGISTEFSIPTGTTIEDRSVTAVVYENNTPANGGSLLGSFTFNSSVADGTLGGGTFATPLSLVGGSQYFIGFENVGPLSTTPNVDDLGVNVTADTGATFLSNWYFDGGGAMFGSKDPNTDEFGQPILAFYAASTTNPLPVPEPGSLALLGTGLICLAGLRLRRRAMS